MQPLVPKAERPWWRRGLAAGSVNALTLGQPLDQTGRSYRQRRDGFGAMPSDPGEARRPGGSDGAAVIQGNMREGATLSGRCVISTCAYLL